MEAAFKKAGGRLFRIVIVYIAIGLAAIVVMAIFTHRVMVDTKEIVLAGQPVPELYSRIAENMKFGPVLSSISGVLIAVAARYGLRETAKSYSDGQAARPIFVNGGAHERLDVEGDSGARPDPSGGGSL